MWKFYIPRTEPSKKKKKVLQFLLDLIIRLAKVVFAKSYSTRQDHQRKNSVAK
jgi:hypothetical protein